MASIEERLKLKRGQVDTWSTKEKLCLASCVLKCGNQNWMSVSRNLKMFAAEAGRPPDWFSQKSCAVQYDSLLDRVETPKRKKRGADGNKSEGSDISPGELIVKQLVAERIDEIKKLMAEVKHTYLRNKEDYNVVESGLADDRLNEFMLQIQEEKKQKEKEQEAHQKWLKEREERKQEMEQAWRPFASQQSRGAAGGAAGGTTGGSQSQTQSQTPAAAAPGSRPDEARRRSSNQSEVSEPESNLESPLSVEIGGEETVEVNTAPTPTSPLLTSLLKSPSQAQSSSILHSAITSQRGASPTITSLLNSSPSIPNNSGSSSPNIKALVTNALASRAEEGPKSVCHTASGSPTLSMLLELPPSAPGQPLPALPSATASASAPAVVSSAAASTPVGVGTAPVNTVALSSEVAPMASATATAETVTVSQPGHVKTDSLPDISAMDIIMPVESDTNIADAERFKNLNIEASELEHLSHADLELVMDPIDMVLGEGDISLVEQMAELIDVSSDDVGNTVNSVLDLNSKDALAVAAQAQKLQAEAEAQLQAAASTPVPVMPPVLPETSQPVTPAVQVPISPQHATPLTAIKDAGTPKKPRPMSRKIDLEVAPEETPIVPTAPAPLATKEESFDEMTELSEAGEEVETYIEPKPEDVMRTVGLSKEALENASIVIIQDDGEVVKMSDVVEEKVETEEVEHKDVVEVVTTEQEVESVPATIVDTPVTSVKVEESADPTEVQESSTVEAFGQVEEVGVDSNDESVKKSRNADIKKEDDDRKDEKEVLPILTLDTLNDNREIILDADDESTLDKIHLLVEEETRKNEAKELCGDEFESVEDKESLEERKNVVETYGEKRDDGGDKMRSDELRSSRDSSKGSRSRKTSKREKSPDVVESSNEATDDISSEKKEKELRKERKTSSSQESDKSDGRKNEKETSRKERKTSSSQDSDKSDGRKSETLSMLLKREEKERRKDEDFKLEDDQDKSSVGKGTDLAEALDDSSRPGDSDKESSVKYEKTRSETPSTEDDKASDIDLPLSRSASTRRARSARERDYSDSVPSSPASVTASASSQAITDEEKDYRAWKKSIMLVYGRIAAHKSASLFLRPITDDKAPGYSQMIYRPMDLFTMKKNIENGVIRTTSEFQRDVLLMFNNAIMYNKSGSHVHEMASAMQEEGVQILKEFVNTQLLLQAVGSDAPNVPSRRGTRTTEKRDLDGDKTLAPKAGASAANSSNTPGSTQLQAGKRKRSLVPDEGRTVSKRRKAEEV